MSINMRDDPSASKSFIFKTLDSLLPLIICSLPDEIKSTHMCTLVNSSLSSLNEKSFNEFKKYLVFDENDISFFKIFSNLSDYLNSIIKSNDNENDKINKIKQLNTVLSLPSKIIIEKNIDIQVAGIHISESIRKLTLNGYSYELCDKLLNILHVVIFKFLTIKISDFSTSNLMTVIDDVFISPKC